MVLPTISDYNFLLLKKQKLFIIKETDLVRSYFVVLFNSKISAWERNISMGAKYPGAKHLDITKNVRS